jgi:hypothetical protein
LLQLSLRHEDPEIAAHWATLVGGSVPTRGRPRRLLVFINPHGGRGHAPDLFKHTIKRLFDLAGIEAKVSSIRVPYFGCGSKAFFVLDFDPTFLRSSEYGPDFHSSDLNYSVDLFMPLLFY